MREGFHGRTLGALGATGLPKYRDPAYPLPAEHSFVPYGELPALQAAFDAAPKRGDGKSGDGSSGVAAVILEPIPSMGGIRVAPDSYFAGLRALCDRAGALLIFDEVQTGFGRTGTLFFGEGAGVQPDLIAGAKGAGGGVPAGVVFVREDISATVHSGDQGTTFGGGPLACVAMATIAQIIADEKLPQNATRVGGHLAARLAAVRGVLSVTGRGLMLGVNLDRPAKDVVAALRVRGVLSGGCEGDPRQIRLLPPLTLSTAEADECVAAFVAVLA
jgi:acetylornithine/succinyldiaminopimelate/putrescine aminotransferase